MTRTIAIALALLSVAAACATVRAPADDASVCQALNPGFPVTFSAAGDTPETIRQIRAVNARFAAACL